MINIPKEPDFDFGMLYDMTGGDSQVIINLLVVINKNLQEYPQQILDLANKQDWEQACKKAHKLKSSIAYLGYDAFVEALSTLELSVAQNLKIEERIALALSIKQYADITTHKVNTELKSLEKMR